MAQEIWAQKQQTVYHTSLPKLKDWSGKRVYELIIYALARENQRLAGNRQTEGFDRSSAVRYASAAGENNEPRPGHSGSKTVI